MQKKAKLEQVSQEVLNDSWHKMSLSLCLVSSACLASIFQAVKVMLKINSWLLLKLQNSEITAFAWHAFYHRPPVTKEIGQKTKESKII